MTECTRCPVGHFEPGRTTITLEDGDTTLVVKNVPADICDKCGEKTFDLEVSRKLNEMLDAAVYAGVETAVREYEHKIAA